jgi:hypothetical protein
MDPRRPGRSLEASVPLTSAMQRQTVDACMVERPRGSHEYVVILEQDLGARRVVKLCERLVRLELFWPSLHNLEGDCESNIRLHRTMVSSDGEILEFSEVIESF